MGAPITRVSFIVLAEYFVKVVHEAKARKLGMLIWQDGYLESCVEVRKFKSYEFPTDSANVNVGFVQAGELARWSPPCIRAGDLQGWSWRPVSTPKLKKKNPVGDFRELFESRVSYCDGNPLALKVLGSFLYLRRKAVWKSALKNLNEAPHKDIQGVMKMSYVGLDWKEQEVFLDIACFFTGEYKTSIVEILGDSAIMIMGILTDLSLIFFSEYDSRVRMHDLVKQMGLAIVLEQSPKEPGKRSPLWRPEEIYHVLENNTVKVITPFCILIISTHCKSCII
ncbi:TIR-NBS-LRR resistance protein [Quillaja saponaria]|uniref:TIR-NBS-LRR resistance protein n=1 Tax=Quillaja saponaria TaxID=32244 RepID=A0AAD7LPB8_QUISA|nr:TIR-NBS-LRR resistance protein [Quillaja saponaria]